MQLLHSQTFPFENINPLLALPVNLDFESLYNKFVDNGRGGYCFEQNIFFMNILKMLGYKVRGLTGRVYNGDNMINRRAHMLLLIRIYGQNYISDVGFGSRAPSQPLLLEVDVEQATKYELFRINEMVRAIFFKLWGRIAGDLYIYLIFKNSTMKILKLVIGTLQRTLLLILDTSLWFH